MRTIIVGFAVCTLVRIACADDTNYQIELTNDYELETPKLSEPFSIEIKDRVWVNKGIEESSKHAKPTSVCKQDGQPQRFRIEPASDSRCSYCTGFSMRLVSFEAPRLVDDAFWPRTKELLDRYATKSANGTASASGAPEVYYVGRIGLQR